MNPLRIAVLGGGIAGLTCAHRLARAGHRPVVYEAGSQVGGLGSAFEYEDAMIDRFYHVLLDSDADLVALLGELGIADRLVWAETDMGFLVEGRLYPFNTPKDLLAFSALAPLDRLRMGLAALYVTTLKKNALDLDNVTAQQWLVRLFGRAVYDRIWDPLLAAKFGDQRSRVPAYWIWNTLNREKNGKQEVKGSLRGGYHGLAQTLVAAIDSAGGQVLTGRRVTRVTVDAAGAAVTTADETGHFDRVVSTLAPHLLRDVLDAPSLAADAVPSIEYQGCVNAVVMMSRRLQPYYWTAVIDPRFAFQGVVETTHVVPLSETGGRHLAYLMNYCAPGSEPYIRSDAQVEAQAVDGLSALYPDFDRGIVEGVRVFRAPAVEPVWTTGYLGRRPAPRVGSSALYLCTTAQAYPRVTAWNTSIALARETVDALLADANARPGARLAA